eukprot:CAMPEP_0184722892 /NCGR_PEP_ID=MMETSP0314-20130426/23612_1 /TAXON_ID=38298 /ORGANISM="Rhodella maculata, Strain CCMP 736" /LENGTH=284 /DNA_ID=CAMNT_0027187581 /DNA_START=55 /DNA_END=907 /DNA_ORIENTATION=+
MSGTVEAGPPERAVKAFYAPLDAQSALGLEKARDEVERAVQAGNPTELDLQQYGLTDSDLESLKESILAVTGTLKTLNLFFNELTQMPAWIADLENLEELMAGCNPFESVSAVDFSKLKKLRILDVGFGETLKSIPDSVGDLASLEKLFVGNNKLQSLPSSVTKLSKLQELHAYGNNFKELPDSIGSLHSLRLLNVGRNQIQSLPESIGELRALESLFVYENTLSRLPASVTKLASLTAINVLNNFDMPMPPQDVYGGGPKAIAAYYGGIDAEGYLGGVLIDGG